MLEALTTERAVSPIAIATRQPLFGWRIGGSETQIAYEIEVRDAQGVMWSTGRVASPENVDIPYRGRALRSDADYSWQLTVWFASGRSAAERATFGTALLDADEPRASWVVPAQRKTHIERYTIAQILAGEAGSPLPPEERLRPPQHVRQIVDLADRPVRARLYATARGIYTAHVNGVEVSDEVLAPGFDSYNSRISVQCFDVTDLLVPGHNVIGLTVADGWYAGRVGMSGSSAPYGDELAVLWHLSAAYVDGTGERWSSGDVPARSARGGWDYADLFIGERFDARRKTAGWGDVGFDDAGWSACTLAPANPTQLVPRSDEPVRRTQMLPCEIRREGDGSWSVDVGQVIAGRLRVRVRAEEGTRIDIEHSEVMSAGGVFFDNIVGPNKDQRDVLITSGAVFDEYEPTFTFHGFRYARLTGDAPFLVESAAAVVIGSDLPVTSRFRASDSRLARLHENIVWSQRGNFLSIPTDCPQRERAGWTGDVQVFAPSATVNMDVRSFLERWLANARADQLPDGVIPTVVPEIPTHSERVQDDVRGAAGWGDAIVLVPWTLYERYGDVRALEENYEAMLAWVDFQQREAEAAIPGRLDAERASAESLARHRVMWNTGWQFGDWLVPSVVREGLDPVEMAKPRLSSEIVTAMYHAHTTRTAARVARVLGDRTRAGELDVRADRIASAFADEYVAEDGTLPIPLQGHYVLALAFGLIPESVRSAAFAELVRLVHVAADHLDTGFLSTPHLLDVLWDGGERDLARRLLLQDTSPSWLYAVAQGATTIWESWEAILPDGTPTRSSMNHYAFGSVDDWIIRKIGGIACAAPGYAEIVIAPDVEGPLDWAETSIETVRGTAAVRWRRSGTAVDIEVVVPSGAVARVEVGDLRRALSAGEHRLQTRIAGTAR
ncbi:glycoside hydrolase family 78 protein [Microbacterium sp. JZ70]